MRFSKGKYIFSRKELWDIQYHLAAIIRDALIQFKNSNRLGFPANINNIKYVEDDHENEKQLQEEWESVLDKIIFAFTEISHNEENDPLLVWYGNGNNTDYKSAPEEVVQESHQYDEKIQEGLKLFAEYYRALWD